MGRRVGRRIGRRWRRGATIAVAVYLGTLAVNRSLVDVSGPSMEPSLREGDRLLTLPVAPAALRWHWSRWRRLGSRWLGSRRLASRRLGSRWLASRRLGSRRLASRRLGSRCFGSRRLGSRCVRPGQVVVVRDPGRPGHLVVKRLAAIGPEGVTVLGDAPDRSTDSRTWGPLPVTEVRRVAIARWPDLRTPLNREPDAEPPPV